MLHKILFLHLSDIHLREETDEILFRAKEIASTTYQYLPELHTVAIVISGDIAWSGKEKEYQLAKHFITEIKSAIQLESKDVRIEIFVCPGNHDCDFALNDDTREAVLSRIRALDGAAPSSSLISTATAVQIQFFAFRNAICTRKWTKDTTLSWQTEFNVNETRIGIRCLNVAWMSELKEKQGTLVFPSEAVTPFNFQSSTDVSITLLHHPYNWFGQSTYRTLQTTVRRESQLVFTGHEHFQNIGEISDIRSSPSVFVEGGVLFEDKKPAYSTFNIVLVDLKDSQYLAELYSWNGHNYVAEVDTEQWGSLRPLAKNERPGCKLGAEFSKTLIDPGANFSHSAKKNLLLEDIFVWPELQCLDDSGPIKKNVSAAFLEDVSNLNSGVLIRGDEKSGKSTLLRQYFSSYFERGYLPLYFRGAWFTKAHQNSPLKAIKFALERQYEKASHQTWLQISKQQKILVLDDIDGSNLSPEVLSICLKGIFSYFSFVIVTAKDSAAAMDLLSIDRIEAISHFAQYDIREFGHKKRFELVCKWAEIGGQIDGSSDKWMSTIDKWEKDLTTAVGRQFVPAVPIFLLTLLQSIESGRTADLQNSAFGHYYQFLVTSSLQSIGVEREQWSEVINYCSNLAWFVYSSNTHRFSESVLKQFNQSFSAEFTPVLFERRLKELTQAGILSQVDGEIEFKYPYLYYYFLGQYVADSIHEPETQQLIVELCNELHLRDNANILLFASHHTKSPIIYEGIAAAIERCFDGDEIFDFERDVILMNNLVNSAPQLVYNEEPTKISRAKFRENQDRRDEANDGMHNLVDTPSAITRLFRGMEILGQFLKNHYGTTKNPVKDQLIDKILQSALRGLRGTTISLIEQSAPLATYLERILEDRWPELPPNDRNARAKRLVFDLVGLITFAFIQKASTAVGSAYLKENLQGVVSKNNTLAYSLIEMSHQLDLPEVIPFAQLKRLNKAVENNVFCQALLRTMALKHLHLFKVPYKDKQKLCEELEIGMNKQMAIQHDRNQKK
jgi:hypothetical protein